MIIESGLINTCHSTYTVASMSLSRSIPNIARYATTSAAPKPKVLVVGAGMCHPVRALWLMIQLTDVYRIGWSCRCAPDLQCL